MMSPQTSGPATEVVDDKPQDDLIEDAAVKHEDHALTIMPDSLRGMSESERLAMEKKIVRKMDLVVLWVQDDARHSEMT
jgi:hypothetical protein